MEDSKKIKLKILPFIFFFCLISCYGQRFAVHPQLLRRFVLNDYPRILSQSKDFKSLSLLNEVEFSSYDDYQIVSFISIDPILTFYNLKTKRFIEAKAINAHISNFLNKKKLLPNNVYYTHLHNDTLDVIIDDDLLVYSFKKEQLLKQSKIESLDGIHFYKSNIYVNKSYNKLLVYSLNGSNIIEYQTSIRNTLKDDIFFSLDSMFMFDETLKDISSTCLDSLNKFSFKKISLPSITDKQLMYVSNKYYIFGYESKNGKPRMNNEILFVDRKNFRNQIHVAVDLDRENINDANVDQTIYKETIDGAPEPNLRPYWRICGLDNSYFMLFQSNKTIFFYEISVN